MLQAQVKEPKVLVHVAEPFLAQLSVPKVHSLMSDRKKERKEKKRKKEEEDGENQVKDEQK